MNAIIRFLKAARSLKNSGITKDQVLEFAKREFGEVSNFMRKQIDNIFKSPAPGAKSESKIGELFGFKNYPKTAQKKTGEVVPFKKKEGMYRSPNEFNSRREYEKYLDEVLGPPDDVFGNPMKDQMLENFDKVKAKNVTPKKEGIETLGEMRLSDDDPMGDLEQILNPKRIGGSLDPAIGITRTLARKILMEKGISIGKADPIDIFDKTFGTDIAIDVKNLAEELLEMERMGKTPKDLDTILKQEGLLDIKIPENPARGMTDDELQKFLKETDEKQILDDFDPTDRDPNAEGGLTRTSYALGKGPVLPSDEDPINPFQPKPMGPVLPDKMAFDDTPRFELKSLKELMDEFEMDNDRKPTSIDDLKRYFYTKYGEDFLAKIDQAVTNESKDVGMKAEFSLQDYMDEFERVFPEMRDKRGTQEYMDMLEDYFRGLASKDRTGGKVQAASGGLAGIINL